MLRCRRLQFVLTLRTVRRVWRRLEHVEGTVRTGRTEQLQHSYMRGPVSLISKIIMLTLRWQD